MNSTNSTLDYQKDEMNLYYVICEVLVAVFAVIGNALVIFVFRKERRLRRRTNYYIVSLAVADLLVGLLGIPFAILSSIGLPQNLHACLFTVSLLVVLCTISIFCLVAVSVDRYWAILHPMGYSRNVRTKTAIVIISVCWVAGSIVGFLPLMGWHKNSRSDGRCFFLHVMDYNYLVFLYFGTIITPALLLAAFYAHIYQVVLKQLRRTVTMNPERGSSSGGTMLRMLGAAQKREVKATQNLAIIVLFFMICWIPLYTINCVLAFCNDCPIDSTFMFSCIILSHINSAGNPLLYAYHLRDFRAALKNFFCNLFGHGDGQGVPSRNQTIASCYNYKEPKIQRNHSEKNFLNSQIYYRRRSNDLANVVKAETNGETSNRIYNIPEGSDSVSSIKHNERHSIVRPATPYKTNDVVNQAYLASSSVDDESDDVFIDDSFPFAEFKCDAGLDSSLEKVRIVTTSKMLSSSSPQLSRLFFIEKDVKEVKSKSLSSEVSCGDETRFIVLTKRPKFGKSLSDEGTTSNESIPRKANGNVVRNSCGS